MKNNLTGWKNVLLLIFPYIFIVGFFQIIGFIISGVDYENFDHSYSSLQDLTISFFTLLGTLLCIWLFMKHLDKERFINLGFDMKNIFTDFKYGFGIGALIMTCGFLLLLYLDEIHFEKIIFSSKEIIISIL